MSSITPDTRPKLSADIVKSLLRKKDLALDTLTILGVRGYYEDEMGRAGLNDRAVYDDAIFIVFDTGEVRSFNANCDPSAYRTGIANLKPGVWAYKRGIHGLSRPPARRYEALVQAAEVTVIRDGKGSDTGWFGINIHRGGDESTSSLGCQTIPADQWATFKSLVYKHAAATIPYVLVTQQELEVHINSLQTPVSQDYSVTIKGRQWTGGRALVDGVMLVPVRRFSEALAPWAVVDWEEQPTVGGQPVEAWAMRGGQAWAPIRKIIEALNKTSPTPYSLVVQDRKIMVDNKPLA